MNPLASALSRVRTQLMMGTLFSTLLNGTILLLAIGVILALISLPWWYALIPALLYTTIRSAKQVKKVKLAEAENKVPDLAWQLRTAEDTLETHNEVVESLHQRVLQKISQLKNTYLMDNKKLALKTGSAIILAALLVVFSTFNIALLDATNPESVTGMFGKAADIGKNALDKIDASFSSKNGDRNIYGEEEIAELGNEELDLKLNREESELNYDEEQALKNKLFNAQNTQGQHGAVADSSYDEDISEEDKQLVKSYFEQLNGESS